MQPLGSLQHCCLLMFTLLWDSTAPRQSHGVTALPMVTLLESPLAQGLRHRHRTVQLQSLGWAAGPHGEMPSAEQALPPSQASSQLPLAVLSVDKPTGTSSSFAAL